MINNSWRFLNGSRNAPHGTSKQKIISILTSWIYSDTQGPAHDSKGHKNCAYVYMLVSLLNGKRTSNYNYCILLMTAGRLQWQRGLSHELSSPAPKLGSWLRIPLKAWMSELCVFILYVDRGLVTGWFPFQGVLPTACRIKKLIKWPRPNKGL
jgi:hypothetical protein